MNILDHDRLRIIKWPWVLELLLLLALGFYLSMANGW